MNAALNVVSGAAVLATEMAGSGAPVVFLHANICDRRMWHAQMQSSATDYQAISYDRRGFGETRAAAENHSAVADLIAVMDATAGAAPAILVGCSQGANIALNAALKHPARVRGLVLISPTVNGAPQAVYTPELREMLARQQQAEASKDLDQLNGIKARLFLDGALAPEGRVTGHVRRLFLEMNAIALAASPAGTPCDDGRAFDRLGEISVPSLVISGKLDFPHIQERARLVANLLPVSQAHTLPDVAHLPGLEQPDIVTGLIKHFVKRCA
ncbi:alpha/beta fold hydrolase [Achromobacter sp. NPDC058515]|uniref:alpha/beta fold hydrolase n=1 Tax=Achromobacter sp. NPDC058515 TaxID=3346533 RepID=UPI0036523F64